MTNAKVRVRRTAGESFPWEMLPASELKLAASATAGKFSSADRLKTRKRGDLISKALAELKLPDLAQFHSSPENKRTEPASYMARYALEYVSSYPSRKRKGWSDECASRVALETPGHYTANSPPSRFGRYSWSRNEPSGGAACHGRAGSSAARKVRDLYLSVGRTLAA